MFSEAIMALAAWELKLNSNDYITRFVELYRSVNKNYDSNIEQKSFTSWLNCGKPLTYEHKHKENYGGVHVSPGSAEILVSWGGKVTYRLIA